MSFCKSLDNVLSIITFYVFIHFDFYHLITPVSPLFLSVCILIFFIRLTGRLSHHILFLTREYHSLARHLTKFYTDCKIIDLDTLLIQEEFEDIKGVIRIRKSKKDRLRNVQRKRTNNDQQNIQIKLKIEYNTNPT